MPHVVMIPTARPTFAVETAQRRADQARALLEELGATVAGPTGLVMSPDDLPETERHLTPDADLVINVCASFSDATPALALYRDLDRPVVLWSFREPGPVGDRLWLNSLCGANLFGHALVRSGGRVFLVHGDPDEPAVRETLREALAGWLPRVAPPPARHRERGPADQARRALDSLRGRRIGVLGEAPAGFTPSEYDPALLRSRFGLEVADLTVDDAFKRIDEVDERDRARELAAVTAVRPSLAALDPEEVGRHAAVTSALRQWAAGDSLAAVAVRCWPEFPVRMGVCPCSSLSRLADEGTPTVCERDVYGAVTMLLLEALGAGTTYLVDTVDLDAGANLVRLWHCGSAATSLAADPGAATQSVHCNRRIGVAGDFPLRTGPVVMARLTENSGGGLRLLVTAGESLPAENRFQGNTADVRLEADAGAFVHGLVTGGFPHHTVLAWTDVRPALRAAADLLDIPVTEW
jgi:L-fucose isomerase-like protein